LRLRHSTEPFEVKTAYSRAWTQGGSGSESVWTHASIARDDELILPHSANPHRDGTFGNNRSLSAKRGSRHQNLLPFGHRSTEIPVRVWAFTTRPCDGPRTVAFSPSVKMN